MVTRPPNNAAVTSSIPSKTRFGLGVLVSKIRGEPVCGP